MMGLVINELTTYLPQCFSVLLEENVLRSDLAKFRSPIKASTKIKLQKKCEEFLKEHLVFTLLDILNDALRMLPEGWNLCVLFVPEARKFVLRVAPGAAVTHLMICLAGDAKHTQAIIHDLGVATRLVL
jgi:hypothetical protein